MILTFKFKSYRAFLILGQKIRNLGQNLTLMRTNMYDVSFICDT